jgi:pimeloyl-ACP methyl ester carboxylesterase
VWQATLAGLTTSPPPTTLGTICAPTLILCGDRDGLLAHEDQVALSETIPNSQLLIHHSVGHLVLWEQPERVATDITRLLPGAQV